MGSSLTVIDEDFPTTFMVPTHAWVERFLRRIKPVEITRADIREILNQIVDVADKEGQATVDKLHALPDLDAMVSKAAFSRMEDQHILRAATFELGYEIYRYFVAVGAFRSTRYPGELPYVFDEIYGYDAVLLYIPF